MSEEDTLAKTKSEAERLSERVQKLENYWYITLGIAAILGIGGGFLGTSLAEAKKDLSSLKEDIDQTKRGAAREFETAKQKAVDDLRSSADAVLTDLRTRRFDSWLAEERTQRDRISQYGGSYQVTDLPEMNRFSIVNPLTGATSCPQDFRAIQVGRIRTPEPQENGTGAKLFSCIKP